MTTTVQIPADTSGAAPEGHDAAMIARVDAKAATLPTQPGESTTSTPAPAPEKILGKFDSVEALQEAYKALEAKLGTNTAPPATQPQPAPTQQAAETLQSKGLDLDSFTSEFAEKGALSPESYDALQKAGFDKGMVDKYVQGQMALAERSTATIYEAVGGKDSYNAMTEWAKSALAPADIDAFNAVVDTQNTAQIKLAVEGLKARYTAAKGSEPNLVSGSTQGASNGPSYESLAQMKAEMKDPRYATDPAWRDMVRNKLARSSIM